MTKNIWHLVVTLKLADGKAQCHNRQHSGHQETNMEKDAVRGQCDLVSSREVNLGCLDSRGGCTTSDLQHPGGRVMPPLDGGHPLKPLQVLDQVAALMPQHAKVRQLQQQTCSALLNCITAMDKMWYGHSVVWDTKVQQL